MDDRTMMQALFDAESGRAERTNANYRTHTIKSGDMLEVEAYPLLSPQAKRAAKRNVTREAQAKVNARNRTKSIVRYVQANFGRDDMWMTLTYAGDAPTMDGAKRDMRNFLRKVRRAYDRAEKEYRALWVIEGADEEGHDVRIHQHVFISGGVDRDALEAMWTHGRAQARRLQPDESGMMAAALYVCKGLIAYGKKQNMARKRCNRMRAWGKSRSLKKSRETIADKKLSRTRAEAIAGRTEGMAKEILEKMYRGYRFVSVDVRTSDFVPGAYIYAIMMRRD